MTSKLTGDNDPLCEVCGEPMPEGEEMFKYHGYSGPCPKPPKAKVVEAETLDKPVSVKQAPLSQLDVIERIARKIADIYVSYETSCSAEQDAGILKNMVEGVSAILRSELSVKQATQSQELIAAAEQLLAWQPNCSLGSSGDLRQRRLRAAIDNFGRDGSLNEATGVKADLEHPGNDTGGETADSHSEAEAPRKPSADLLEERLGFRIQHFPDARGLEYMMIWKNNSRTQVSEDIYKLWQEAELREVSQHPEPAPTKILCKCDPDDSPDFTPDCPMHGEHPEPAPHTHERVEEGEVYEDWGHPPDRPICICDPQGRGFDKECPVHGEHPGDSLKLPAETCEHGTLLNYTCVECEAPCEEPAEGGRE